MACPCPCLLSSLICVSLCMPWPRMHAGAARVIIYASYMLWGIGVPMCFIIMVIYFRVSQPMARVLCMLPMLCMRLRAAVHACPHCLLTRSVRIHLAPVPPAAPAAAQLAAQGAHRVLLPARGAHG
jgi:hypothetical protein